MCHSNIGKLVFEKVTKELLQPAISSAVRGRIGRLNSDLQSAVQYPCCVDAIGSTPFSTFAKVLPCVKQLGLPVAVSRSAGPRSGPLGQLRGQTLVV